MKNSATQIWEMPLLTIFFILAFYPSYSSADTIKTKHGVILHGDIKECHEKYMNVVLEGGGQSFYPVEYDEIELIRFAKKGRIIDLTSQDFKIKNDLSIYICDQVYGFFGVEGYEKTSRHDLRGVSLPYDQGPHDDANTEWWYFSGVAESSKGEIIGFHHTIFRQRIPNSSQFGYIGHIGVTDVKNQKFYFQEIPTFEIPNNLREGSSLVRIDGFSYGFSDAHGFNIQTSTDEIKLNLQLKPTLDPLMIGSEEGVYVIKSGYYQYYYLYSNLATKGTITIKGEKYKIVKGRTWMEHQWGKFAPGVWNWDWFSLRFDDGDMLSFSRHLYEDGTPTNGVWIYREGGDKVFWEQEIPPIKSIRTVKDTINNITYPVEWIIDFEKYDAKVHVKPVLDEQFTNSTFVPDYWEGLCTFDFTRNGKTRHGYAYVELQPPMSRNKKTMKFRQWILNLRKNNSEYRSLMQKK